MPRYRNIHAIRAIRFRPTKSLYRLLHRAQEAIGKSSRTNRNTTLLARTYNARLHTLRWYYFQQLVEGKVLVYVLPIRVHATAVANRIFGNEKPTEIGRRHIAVLLHTAAYGLHGMIKESDARGQNAAVILFELQAGNFEPLY